MPLILIARRLRRLLGVYLLAVALVTAVYAALNARAMHPWIDGEWVINYSAGLVRRGLLGEMLLLGSRGLHLPLFGLALVLQLLVYAWFYLGVYRLSKGVRWSLLLIAALLSPATLAFTVLDPPSSVRKEALLFAVLASVLHTVLAAQERRVAAAMGRVQVVLLVAAPTLVLTHEALFCYLPYLFAAPLLWVPSWRAGLRVVALPIVLAMVAAGLVLTHPGNAVQAAGICDSVAGTMGAQLSVADVNAPCGGAIAYLGKDRDTAHRETMRAAQFYRYRTRYPLPMVLSLVPAALLLGRRIRRRLPEEMQATRVVMGCAVVALLASLPLFFVARDWGRWMHLHATCLMLLLLAVERPPMALLHRTVPGESGLVLATEGWRRVAAGGALLLYATAWTLPAVGIFPGRYGYLDLWRYVTRYKAHEPRQQMDAPANQPLR